MADPPLDRLRHVQATVASYDGRTRNGTVVTDDGVRYPFSSTALADSRLRLLRPGQRVRAVLEDGEITEIQIVTLAR
jgi:2-phospho-L-lactate/phosphoenolpyruvate guanylyltransferase